MKGTKRRAEPGSFSFEAKVVRKDFFFGIDVPAAVSAAIDKKGFVPVLGSINGAPVRSSLSPSRGGRHHLLLNREVRTTAKVEPGDRVKVVLRVDLEPPVFEIAEDLADALREEGVLADFEALPRGRRNQYIGWMEEAAHEDTRAKRIGRLVEIGHAERERRVDRASRRA
ncbi:MAG: YdeI/OmpD-associated family protein [Polyangiaceae bacterium]